MVQFSCSASESLLSAVRVARAYTGRTKITKFEGGHHGFTDPVSISAHPHDAEEHGTDESPRPVVDSAGIPIEVIEQVVVLTQDDMAGTERILQENAEGLTCVILELESVAGGHMVLRKDFVQMIRRVTAELGILFVLDETMNLRGAYNGMQSLYGADGDLTVMGRIIGGELPFRAVAGKAAIMQVMADGTVPISGTHHGHRLALVAGIGESNPGSEIRAWWAAMDRSMACCLAGSSPITVNSVVADESKPKG